MHIKQKILVHIERLQSLNPKPSDKTVVLFLPKNETHDLGLQFINYEILCYGFHSIFLAESIPMEDLKYINKLYDEITYISYFTVEPEEYEIERYLKRFAKVYLENSKNRAKFTGRRICNIDRQQLPEKIQLYKTIEDLVKDL